VNFPQYHDPIIKYGPEKCIDTLLQAIESIDKLLDLPEPVPSLVKGLFGLEGLNDNADFGEVISSPLGLWQAKNWDPAGEPLSSAELDRRVRLLINQLDLKGSTTSATP
jgi:hypothetical protein